MFEWFFTILATNNVAQGVIAGILATAPLTLAAWLLKDVPLKVWNFLKNYFSLELTILSSMEHYDQLVNYAHEHIIWSREKSVNMTNVGITNYNVGIGYGTHFGKYKGVFFKLVKNLQENQASRDFKETTTIIFFSKKEEILNYFLAEAKGPIVARNPRIYVSEDGWWNRLSDLGPRSLNSIFYDKKSEILDILKNFKEQEENYLKKGMPYRTGFLFTGEPGTGKTSIIHALAWTLKKDVFYLNPTSLKANSVISLFNGDWRERILVIEDIDVSGASVNREDEEESISLSEMLNSIDGIISPYGLITMATTNHVEKLDPALTRPGRFDNIFEVGKLKLEEAEEMSKAFDAQLPNPYIPMTGAELRNYFIKNNS